MQGHIIRLGMLLMLIFGFTPLDHVNVEPEGNSIYLPIMCSSCSVTEVFVQNNSTMIVDNTGTPIIIGEVINGSLDPVDVLVLKANLYDLDHNLITDHSPSIFIKSIPPKGSACFKYFAIGNIPDSITYEFEPLIYERTQVFIDNFTGSALSSYFDEWGYFYIKGQVRNENDFRVNSLWVNATIYNKSGDVIGCSEASLNPEGLDAGQSAPFTIITSGVGISQADHFKIRFSSSG